MRSESTNFAVRLHDDLERERETHRNTIPTAWILSKFRQIGLEAYVHNFTLNYPLGGGRTFSGKNVYGILRAPRIGSTEAIVISTPYRTPESIHPIVMPSLPVLIAFANFARSTYQSHIPTYSYVFIYISLNFRTKVLGKRYNIPCHRSRTTWNASMA